MLSNFLIPGRASFIIGGQFGSEAKGAAAAWVASKLKLYGAQSMTPGVTRFDIVTTNAGAQAGHTSIHNGEKRVVYHLPTAPLIAPGSIGYLNAGAIIDPDVLMTELEQFGDRFSEFWVHPNAAIITPDCRDAEGRADSAQTKIAGTRKGVGEAYARKALRSGQIADRAYVEFATEFSIKRFDLNAELLSGKSVLVEVPQGIGLSVNGPFYPYCTSRDCTVAQAANDAGIHPSFVGPVMLVLRTFPIRVGNIVEEFVHQDGSPADWARTVHSSGGCYPDQHEISWSDLGVEPEITTVTKRVRRVFTWSQLQVIEAMRSARPTHVFLSHVDYLGRPGRGRDKLDTYVLNIMDAAWAAGVPAPQIFFSIGPTTGDVHEATI